MLGAFGKIDQVFVFQANLTSNGGKYSNLFNRGFHGSKQPISCKSFFLGIFINFLKIVFQVPL